MVYMETNVYSHEAKQELQKFTIADTFVTSKGNGCGATLQT
jgi:hypothetical protein